MSVAGIASSILSGLSGLQHGQPRFQKIRGEFQQPAEDLQSGNLAQARQDFTTLSQNFPGLSQTSGATSAAGSSQTGANPLLQAFNQLGQDLQAGNLQAAQQDFTTIQQTARQNAQQNIQQPGGHHHHHRHHVENSQGSSSSSSTSQQTNPIAQAFSQLAQTLQSGNLQGAQQALATLRNDLQQIGGFISAGSAGASSVPAGAGSLNVTA